MGDAQELEAILEDRRKYARTSVARWSSLQRAYSDWDDRVEILDNIYAGLWDVVWPDQVRERALPKVPNYPRISRKHRTQLIAETMPTVACRPEKMSDTARHSAEKRERILAGYWLRSYLSLLIPEWGGDLMDAGLSIVKVLPSMSVPRSERFPHYMRLDPRWCYPSPMYTHGPFVDDLVMGYEMLFIEAQRKWPAGVQELRERSARVGQLSDTLEVIEYYDHGRAMVTLRGKFQANPGMEKPWVPVEDFTHDLGKTPIAIGVTPTADGTYRSPFDDGLAMLNTANRLMTLHLDSAMQKVYAELVVDGEIENPTDRGPGAVIMSKANDNPLNHIGYLNHPAAAYDNYQIMRSMDAALRTAFLLPPSVTGDPNESVTSAAGIAATQTMPNAEVVSLQRDSIAPMLQAANELAFRVDEKLCDTKKTITGVQRGAAFAEEYTPSKDIDGNYSNDVIYGEGAGLDKVNTNVMLLQNKGEGMISERTAREKSPFVEDPIREEQQIAIEQLTKAAFAAIIAGAAAPPGDPRALTPQQIADIWDDLEKSDGSLKEAIRSHLTAQQVPLVPTAPQAGPGLSAPGLAAAQEPQPPSFAGAPPLEEVLA